MMNEKEEQEEQFVMTHGSTPRVHRVDCPHVWHLVTRAPREGYGQSDYESVGYDQEGRPLYREVRYTVPEYYSPDYVTRQDLRELRHKYARCQVCVPDVPETMKNGRAITRSIKTESLTPDHIGRRFTDVGVLARVVMSSEGYELEGDAGSVLYPAKTVLRYFNDE